MMALILATALIAVNLFILSKIKWTITLWFSSDGSWKWFPTCRRNSWFLRNGETVEYIDIHFLGLNLQYDTE